jgi:hypothetical protein
VLEHGLRVVGLPVGGGLRVRGLGGRAGHPLGERSQYALAGDPAFELVLIR